MEKQLITELLIRLIRASDKLTEIKFSVLSIHGLGPRPVQTNKMSGSKKYIYTCLRERNFFFFSIKFWQRSTRLRDFWEKNKLK